MRKSGGFERADAPHHASVKVTLGKACADASGAVDSLKSSVQRQCAISGKSTKCSRTYMRDARTAFVGTDRSGLRLGISGAARAQGIDCQLIAAHLVLHHHVEGRGGAAFFHVASHVKPGLVGASVDDAVDDPR